MRSHARQLNVQTRYDLMRFHPSLLDNNVKLAVSNVIRATSVKLQKHKSDQRKRRRLFLQQASLK